MKRARGNSLGARTAREEFVLASHGRDKDSSGPLICLWGDFAGHCLILVKYPTGDDVKASTPAGPSIWRIQQQQSTTNAQVRSKLYMCLEDCKEPEVSE